LKNKFLQNIFDFAAVLYKNKLPFFILKNFFNNPVLNIDVKYITLWARNL